MGARESVSRDVSIAFVWLMLGAALPWHPAVAQIISQSAVPQPAERVTIDKQNVDVTSGSVILSAPELSIGSGSYGLTLTHFYSSATGWRDSFTGALNFQSWGWSYDHNAYSASWGAESWAFGSGVDHSMTGAVLNKIDYDHYQVITHDGTVISYANLLFMGGCAGEGDGANCSGTLQVEKVEYPNGVVVIPHYRIYNGSTQWTSQIRIQSITSNTGYQIKFVYQSNTISDNSLTWSPWLTRVSAIAINNGVEYCDPNADSCGLSGNWPTVTYTNSTGTHTVTDPLGRSTVYTYGPTTFRVRTAGSSTDNLQYTLATFTEYYGNLVSRVTSATIGGSTWSYGYSPAQPSALTTTVTDPQGGATVYNSTRYEFGDAWSSTWSTWALVSMKDPLNRTTVFSYPCGPSNGVLSTQSYVVTSPEGIASSPVCDTRGNVTSTTVQSKPGSGAGSIVTSATFPTAAFPVSCANYKTCNKPLTTTDGRGAQTDYSYDAAHGGVLIQTLPADINGVRPQKRYQYQQFSAYVKNAGGTLVAAPGGVWLPIRVSECRSSNYGTTSCGGGPGDEIVTTYEYAAPGTSNRLLVRGAVVTWNGTSFRSCFSYDHVGNQVSVTSPRALLSSCPETPTGGAAFTTWSRYDAARQLVGTISPPAGGHVAVRNTYDAEGRVTKTEHGSFASWHSDWTGFAVSEVTDTTYDSMGRVLTQRQSSGTGANAVLVQLSYDSLGRPECTAVRMNAAVYASLPASACTLSTQGSAGPDRIKRLTYDAAGQVLTEKRAYGTNLQQDYATYAYTPDGRQDWVEDSNGNRTDFTYDGFDRVNRVEYPSATLSAHVANSADYEFYSYDANSNRTSVRLRSGETIQYYLDNLNRVYRKQYPGAGGDDIYYGYDLQNLNLSARFGTLVTSYGVTNVFDGFGRQQSQTSLSSTGSLGLTFTSDEDGNRTQIMWPDGNYVQYAYDGMDRMKQVRENGASSGAGLLADYSYDASGHRSNVVRGNGTVTTYYYDGISRLSNLTQDLASTSGDVTFGFGYNEASQVTQRTVSNDSYSYFSLPMTKAYTRDGRNRYTSVAGVTFGYDGRDNLTSDGSRTFTYDLDNHLRSVSGSSSLVLSYDPIGRLQATTSGGKTTRYLYEGDRLVAEYEGSTLVRRYAHGAGVDEPLVWYEGSNLNDRRWLHVDHQGNVVATSDGTGFGTQYAYGPYGEPAYDNWGGVRFRYTGQIMLPEAKLYHYKARVYDPTLGRFLQTDPVGYQADFNMLAYVGDDPVNRTDPSGLAKVCVAKTGSHIDSCVNVDGNGDGNTQDNDLTKGQIEQLSHDFSKFIQENNGKDLSKNGLDVENLGATQDAENMARVVSQFVGTARSKGWRDRVWQLTVGTRQAFKDANRTVPTDEAPAWNIPLNPLMGGPKIGERIYIATESEGILRPSNLSRAFIHETLHFNDTLGLGQWAANLFGWHGRIDTIARQLNVRYGFGKCDAMGGFPGC